MSTFNKWLQNVGLFNSDDSENKKFTHLLLNGGKLYVEDIDLFNEKYSTCIEKNEYIYLVECRPDIFPLFFDLDFLLNDENDLNEKTIISIIQNINDTIKLFYDIHFKCIVTTADIKIVNKNDKNYIKKGYHLHWTDLIVNKNIALDIRLSCIVKLKTIYGNQFANSFNDIIDEHVFNSSGLRLTGSRKGHYVAQAKKFVDEGRPYDLFKVFINNNIDSDEYYKLKDNNHNLIKETSIIIKNKNVIEPVHNPSIDIKKCEECEDNRESKGDWDRLGKSTLEYIEILRFFKNYVKDYSVNDIKRIFCSENNNVYIIWTKSKYCLNILRDHNSCGIYFKLNKDGICQKCFCKCDTMEGRKYGYCRDFSSTIIPCTPHLQKLLNFNNNNSSTTLNKMECNNLDDFRSNLYNVFTNKTPIRTKKPVNTKKPIK